MPRSTKIHPDRKQQVLLAIERNGFLTQGDLAANLYIASSTLNNFINSRRVSISTFEKICEKLGLDKQEIQKPVGQSSDFVSEQPFIPVGFYAYDDAWVGREELVKKLSDKLRGSCRLLMLLGLTGIGKTAFAEKLAVELQDWFGGDWKYRFCRANFDDENKPTDFASIAARWLEGWGERLLAEEKKPELLLNRLLKHLQENQMLVLIDSLERLLTGNEEDGWGDFADQWWEKFFLNLLSAESCRSQWELHKLTRQVREQVNKQRLEITFQRLARNVKDAYILLCAASVYRTPEKEDYWLNHLVHWLKRLKQPECTKERQIRALEELSNRFLLEESFNHKKKRILGQHTLIRSLAIEHRNQLLQSLKAGD